jgi:hypothetical protein
MVAMTDREIELVNDLRSRMNILSARKEPFRVSAKEVSELLYVNREGYAGESGQSFTVGKNVYDGTPIAALQLLSDGLTGSLCSPAIAWIKFKSRNKEAMKANEFLSYLRDMEEAFYAACNRSNFYEVVSEAISDGSALGTAVVYGENAKDLGRAVFSSFHYDQFYLEENRYNEVDTYFIERVMTMRQVYQEYASFGFSESFMQRKKDNPDSYITVVQAVYPRETKGKLAKKKPWASVHFFKNYSDEGRTLLRESGYDYDKFVAWRFRHYPNCAYGGSPGLNALSDIKMINLQSKTMADAAQLSVQPPMLTSESMMGRIKIAPRAIMYSPDPNVTITPVQTIASYPLGIDSMDRRERIIREHFKTDFFMAVSQMQKTGAERRTAYEVMEVKSEAAVVLGTTTTRLTSEFLDPLSHLVIEIEKEGGRWPRVPAGFESAEVEIEFTGPLAQAQRQYLEVQSNLNGFNMALQLAQANPDVLLNFDLNYLSRRIAEAGGMDPKAFLTEFNTKKAQEQAAQKRAEMEQAAMQNETMKAASGAGKPIDPTSMLAQMGVK